MNEEIEYAEMLEIPVSTVNVVRKNQRRRKQKASDSTQASEHVETSATPTLKASVIAQVNDRLNEPSAQEEITAEAELFTESANSAGELRFDPIPERIDTVRLYSDDYDPFGESNRNRDNYGYERENDGGRYATNEKTAPKALRVALGAEFALACALCGAIFLTNVFMPNSAINTFFRSLSGNETTQADARPYSDFTLSAVVSELSDAELNLSPTGILSFTDECCVYPAANGKISSVTKTADGGYTVKIAHSDTFTGVVSGLDHVYYSVGEEVKANVPLGYSGGETEVQVTMYSNGELLNCFQLTEENCLAWVSVQ